MKTSRNYLLVLLTVIMVFNYVDRFALGLMLQDIKRDLLLTDTQLGLLTGIAFALFYAAMGIPIARWADRGNRVTIISVTAAIWSAMVALCGTARSFTQLILLRIGAAVGEAGCHPPAFSLIADYFGRNERPRAIARYTLGWPVALLIGYFAAGWWNQYYGWRSTFVILGLPGLGLALLAVFTLKEPRQSGVGLASDAVPAPTLREVFGTLWDSRAWRRLLFASSLSYFFSNGILQWQPAFFVRSHGMQTGELGTWLALTYGVGGFVGTWLGGELVAKYASNNERLQLRGIAMLYSIFAIVLAVAYSARTAQLALAGLALSTLGSAGVNGPLFSATQTLVRPQMRAMSIAIVMFFCNLVGLGLGPLAVGTLSDSLRPWLGEESLRYALIAMCPGYFWCAWHLWQASRTVTEDLAIATRMEAA